MRPMNGAMPRFAQAADDGRAASETLWTSLRYFAYSRVVLAALLVLFVAFDDLSRFAHGAVDRRFFAVTALAYLVLALTFAAVATAARRGFDAQLLVQGLADLVALTLLMHAAGGPRSGIGVLMVAAVGGAAVLSTPLRAAFFAASATLLLLGEAAWRALRAPAIDAGDLAPAALVGAACFVTATLINRLAMRLATQEALARQRGDDLQAQLAITRLVISELPQGVVVLDARGRVRTMNRSAQQLLGVAGPWPAIERLFAARAAGAQAGAAAGGGGAHDATDVVLDPPAGSGVRASAHRVRVRFLHPDAPADADTVLVIEDQREVEERAQQLKLASMGRLSASIAHEIRNPLAAIRHANGLLAEQLTAAAQQRLARIVEDNSVRIDRIVEDVLSISRRERPTLERIDVARFVGALVDEFVALSGAQRSRIEVAVLTDAPLAFDPRHLRLVLVNLMTNALRYATNGAAAVRLEWRRGVGDRLEFLVADDGPGLSPEMLEHAFEPFFTTEARGTGLGLFLAREFCTANRAALRYERFEGAGRHSGAFVILPGAASGE